MIFDIKNECDVQLLEKAVGDREVGITSGSFDLFRHAHLIYLMRCRRQCDLLIVGIDSNDLVVKRKGPERPLVSEHQRLAVINSLSCVHAVFIMDSVEDFGVAVERLRARTIFRTQGYEKIQVFGADRANVVFISDPKRYQSTTEIVGEILKRRSEESEFVPQVVNGPIEEGHTGIIALDK